MTKNGQCEMDYNESKDSTSHEIMVSHINPTAI